MAVATLATSPAQAHHVSPTIRPMGRQSINKATTICSQFQHQPRPSSYPQSRLMDRRPSPPKSTRPQQHIWVVTGPAGCGKTTVGQALAEHLGVPYVEGDDHHPKSNRDKMSRGIPLSDADRWDWLIALRDHAVSMLVQPAPTNPSADADATLLPPPAAASPHSPPSAVVVTCSALKLKYRDEFRVASLPIHARGLRLRVHFIYLAISQVESLARVRARKGHFMGAEMVGSQFASLEAPSADERAHDVVEVDVEQDVEGVMADVVRGVQEALDDAEEQEQEEGRGYDS